MFATPVDDAMMADLRQRTIGGEPLADESTLASLTASLARPPTRARHGGDRRGGRYNLPENQGV